MVQLVLREIYDDRPPSGQPRTWPGIVAGLIGFGVGIAN